jgi:hypothetical protein
VSLRWRIWRFLGADRIRQSLAGLAPEFKLLAHGFGQRAELDAFVRCKMPEIGEVGSFRVLSASARVFSVVISSSD